MSAIHKAGSNTIPILRTGNRDIMTCVEEKLNQVPQVVEQRINSRTKPLLGMILTSTEKNTEDGIKYLSEGTAAS